MSMSSSSAGHIVETVVTDAVGDAEFSSCFEGVLLLDLAAQIFLIDSDRDLR